MDNKGFTLVEMLAVVVILSIILGVASFGVSGVLNTSKLESESAFVGKLSDVIEEYIQLNSSFFDYEDDFIWEFNKCYHSTCNAFVTVTAWELKSISMNDLVEAELLEVSDVVNPANKNNCLKDGKNPDIRVFKDSDFVYYYYVDLRGENTSCDISEENGVINTLPDNLKEKVGIE